MPHIAMSHEPDIRRIHNAEEGERHDRRVREREYYDLPEFVAPKQPVNPPIEEAKTEQQDN